MENAGAVLAKAARRLSNSRKLFIPALAAVAITYTLWVNVYPPQPGAYRVIPWIVLAWCCMPLIATLLHPRFLDLVTSGCLAVGARMKQD